MAIDLSKFPQGSINISKRENGVWYAFTPAGALVHALYLTIRNGDKLKQAAVYMPVSGSDPYASFYGERTRDDVALRKPGQTVEQLMAWCEEKMGVKS